MTRLLSFLLPLLLLLLSSAAPAAENPALTTLRQQQAAVYGIVREFHMETFLAGDPVRTAQLKKAIDNFNKGLQSLPAKGNSAAFDSAVADVRVSAPRFIKLAQSNNIVHDGYTDDNLVGDLYNEADVLHAALGKAIAALPAGGKQRAVADRAHAANLLLQRAVASYLKRGAQMTPDVGSEDPFDVGEATQRLDKQMKDLAGELRGNESMAGVLSKWNFIRGSLVNYNEKTVPFIVDRYASQINDGLGVVIAGLDAK